ncbi:hypothetical protein AJ78_06820 [Emergomyces pasteurianus Ep9510]|uniref:Mid2 domain-containing protein n=1 Tax=Emergomyces pasteurianus Ep9510 TaxID=1447872 RepID=A0A1J9Q8V9_9EURO|nr:hypothetical protein AJ78_06820 [Emergomyces pasteurianus Ep9510]
MRYLHFHSAFRLPALHSILLAAYLSPLLLSTPSQAAAGRKCYLPSGELEDNDAPCFPQNPESACCGGSKYVCSTNNMCAHYDGSYYVIGSCTDPTWNSPACPGYCYFRDHVHNSVVRCDEDTYCCLDGPSCNCTTKVNSQKILDFLPPYSELVGSSVSLNTEIATTSLVTPLGATRSAPATTKPTASTTNTQSTTATASDSASKPASGSASGSASSVINPTRPGQGAVGGSTLQPEVPTGQGKSNDLGMKIGLGVGIPLAVIAVLLAVLVYRLWKRGSAASRGAGAGGTSGVGHNSGPGSRISGLFSRVWTKDDPSTRLPMLPNTQVTESPYAAMNQPTIGRGYGPPTNGHFKPDDAAMMRTPHVLHEAP